VINGGNFKGRDEEIRQGIDIAAHGPVDAIRVIFDRVVFLAAVRHALAALVKPGKCRLDAIGGVIGKGQRYGSGRSDGSQVGIAYAMLADGLLQLIGQALGKVTMQIFVCLQQREGATLLRELYRGLVSSVTHLASELRSQLTA